MNKITKFLAGASMALLIGGAGAATYAGVTGMFSPTVSQSQDEEKPDLPTVEEQKLEIDISSLGLKNSDGIYYKGIKDGFLISSNKEDCGLWIFDSKTEALSKLSTFNSDFSIFIVTPKGIIINGLNDSGLLSFNDDTREVKQIYSGGTLQNYKELDEGYLISSSKDDGTGLLFFDNNTGTCTQVYSEGANWKFFNEVEGGCFISASSNLGKGLLYFNNSTHKVTQIYAEGYAWQNFSQYEDGYFIGAGNYCYGLLYFNNSDQSVKEMYSDGRWENFIDYINGDDAVRVDDGYLVASPVGRSRKTLFFNVRDFTFTELPMNYSCSYFDLVEGGCLVSGTSNGVGLWFFDNITHVASEIYNDSQNGWKEFHHIKGGVLIIGERPGMIYYNEADHSVKEVYTDYRRPSYFQPVEGGCLIGVDYTVGSIQFFDSEEQTLSSVYQGYWEYFYLVEGGCLIGSDEKEGLLFYDNETHSVEQIYSENTGWSCFQSVEGGCLIGGKGLLFYDYSNRSVTEISSDYNCRFFQPVEGGCLVSSRASGILYFDNQTHSITNLYSEGKAWEYFQLVEDGCLISSSNYECGGLLFYDKTSKTVTRISTSHYAYGQPVYVEVDDGFIVHNIETSSSNRHITIIHYISATHTAVDLVSSAFDCYNITQTEDELTFTSDQLIFIVNLHTFKVTQKLVVAS